MSKFDRNISVTTPTEGEFKGNPTISLPTDDPKWPMTFGVAKARAIVTHIEAVRAFVAKHAPAVKKPDAAALVAAMSAEERAALAALLAK
jgi:hypothetical protein